MLEAHIRCGSDIRGALADEGVPGEFIEYSDPVCQGPAPNGDEAVVARTRWISSTYEIPGQETEAKLRAESAALQGIDRFARITLWFEHDPYDQIILIRLLDKLGERPGLVSKLRLVQIDRHATIERFVGFGQLAPMHLAALLESDARPVTSVQTKLASQAWNTYCKGDIAALFALASDQPTADALPFLGGSLLRLLQELPDTSDGLGLTERLSLRALESGAETPGQAFRALFESSDPLPYLGDLMYWPFLRRLASGPKPALSPYKGPREPISLTEIGHALLAGEADWVSLRGVDHWIGGAHIKGQHPAWRWSDESGRPTPG